MNYTIKCDGSVKFENGQDIDATYCTATTETTSAVSRFGTASLSVTILQTGSNASDTTRQNTLFINTPTFSYSHF